MKTCFWTREFHVNLTRLIWFKLAFAHEKVIWPMFVLSPTSSFVFFSELQNLRVIQKRIFLLLMILKLVPQFLWIVLLAIMFHLSSTCNFLWDILIVLLAKKCLNNDFWRKYQRRNARPKHFSQRNLFLDTLPTSRYSWSWNSFWPWRLLNRSMIWETISQTSISIWVLH